MAGVDATLLALSGTGYADGRSFGFASCERAVGAAEARPAPGAARRRALLQGCAGRGVPETRGSGLSSAPRA